MIVISYFTPDYAEHADRLRTSCRQFGYRYWVEPIKETGSWLQNCAAKGEFVRRAIQASSEPVLWLDADAEIKGSLYALENIGADLAIHEDASLKHMRPYRLRSGTMLFGCDPPSLALATKWAERCKQHPEKLDQETLLDAWEPMARNGLNTHWLDGEYCCRYDDPGADTARIVHYQASRETRRHKNAKPNR